MKKIMILGAGSGQVPFINISHKLGAEVIAVSINGNYPGIKIADKFYDVDTRDKEKILEIAKAEKIDAITTDQTDVSITAVAYVAEKLGLKGIGYERALTYTNKYMMRNAAKAAGVGVPGYFKTDNLEEALEKIKDLTFPLIIKPVDSSGSRGVVKLDNVEMLKEHFETSRSFSLAKDVIIEEFVTGTEYIVDGFAIDGKYINTDLSIKDFFHLPNMCIPQMCMFTCASVIDDYVEKKVLEANKKLVDYIGLPFGITHAAYIYDPKKDEVFLVEIAARGGGDFISSHLTPKACGIDTNTYMLDYLLNDKVIDVDSLKLSGKVSGYTSFGLKEGVVKRVEGIDIIKSLKGMDNPNIDIIKPGLKAHALRDNTDKYGPMLFSGETREDCFEIIDKVKECLKIYLEGDDENSAVIW